jgi:hypothetical protein
MSSMRSPVRSPVRSPARLVCFVSEPFFFATITVGLLRTKHFLLYWYIMKEKVGFSQIFGRNRFCSKRTVFSYIGTLWKQKRD